ncbi:MAG: glycoside hydrolase family 15 protein [Myxococcales bacterium]|jgi:GH15 family glucan-1,4-alpha-glucosidase|nr:glycoside hydrolase family 15 protein [Myxococcales bacterium]
MRLNQLGLIGNCQISALVSRGGSIVWSCMPRFDAPPVFASLLDEGAGGSFDISPADGSHGVQRYLPNTNVLETRFESDGSAFRVLDFAPRLVQYARSFRPTKLVRIVEPLLGTPRIRVRCRPTLGWSRKEPRREHGSNHVSFCGYDAELRLTTDAPQSYLDGESFALTETKRFVLAWGSPVEEPLEPLCDRFLRETIRYWQTWVKHCDIPPIYQEEVIRSALVLKLHCFEDTGAIVAALTTSIPESPGSGRTWDYRYCWLRDAFYALGAFRLLGHFEEREQFLQFLLNVASSTPDLELAPLYRIDGRSDLDEKVLVDWAGFEGEKPVRIGNLAATHRQNDVFGEMVLALAPLFLDARFRDHATAPVLDLVTRLTRKAIRVAGQPDAGIWEIRSEWRPQTFSTLMCWAAADRMSRIAARHCPGDAEELQREARRIRAEILGNALDPTGTFLVADHGGTEVDAALLQAVTLRLLEPSDRRLDATIDAVIASLQHGGWLRRYRTDDGLGVPSVAFILCTFWLVEALSRVGRLEEARALMDRIRTLDSPLGLLAEDLDPDTGRMWGNFPQAYSHVGMIHAAFAASPRWSEVE